MGTLANSEDPEEISQKVIFNQSALFAKITTIFRDWNKFSPFGSAKITNL